MGVYHLDGKIITDTISMDEPCHGLLEAHRLVGVPEGGTAWHRVQDVFVVRGDEIASYQTDLGPIENFDAPPVAMLGVGEDTVGEMVDEADRSRADPYYAKLQKELHEGSSLIQDFINQKEANWKVIKNQSTFGPAVTRQRNGFPYQEVHKQALARGKD
jgi:hypothetical protein